MTHLGPYPLDSVITGDARELAKAIPDESVDLIFTDPVYDRIDDYRWLAETAARVLKPGGSCLMWQAVKWLADTFREVDSLTYKWTFIWYQSNRRGHADFGYPLYTPLLWYTKGKASTRYPVQDIIQVPFSGNGEHVWQKQPETITRWLHAIADDSAVVFDPFTGGGTVPAVCKMLHRHYLAFEIDPDTAERARQRVLMTQAPLVFPEPEQLALEV